MCEGLFFKFLLYKVRCDLNEAEFPIQPPSEAPQPTKHSFSLVALQHRVTEASLQLKTAESVRAVPERTAAPAADTPTTPPPPASDEF